MRPDRAITGSGLSLNVIECIHDALRVCQGIFIEGKFMRRRHVRSKPHRRISDILANAIILPKPFKYGKRAARRLGPSLAFEVGACRPPCGPPGAHTRSALVAFAARRMRLG